MNSRSWVAASLLALSCTASKPVGAPAAPAAPLDRGASTARATPTSAPLTGSADPRLATLLTKRGLSGVVARLDGDARTARCNDVALCQRALTPASTFKIPNSIVGLETGVILDADFVIPWDGVKRRIDAWNHDHTLRSAIRDSAVPYYQELARRVGLVRMRDWLQRLEYGNRQTGDAVDQFWLEGPLAITPLEQLDFLRKLDRARLPIAKRTRDIVLDITRLSDIAGKPFHGKTGWAHPDEPGEVGWFVGWIEDATQPRYVAVAVLAPPQGTDMMNIRRAIAEEALQH